MTVLMPVELPTLPEPFVWDDLTSFTDAYFGYAAHTRDRRIVLRGRTPDEVYDLALQFSR